MSRCLVTLSGLQRASICTASVVLPRYDSRSPAASLGSALHEVIERRITGEQMPPETIANTYELTGFDRGRFLSLCRSFDPKVPAGTLAEVALGLFDDDSVGEVKGGHGEYQVHADCGPLVTAGTIDAMWSDPPLGFKYGTMRGTHGDAPRCPEGGTLWIVDWKTGDEGNVAPPATNWQLRGAAVLAAKWTGARRVIPALCFIDGSSPDGRWDIGAAIEGDELDSIAATMVEILNDIEHAADAYEKGIGPRATTGPHCEHCPARPGCPAHMVEVRALVTDYHHDGSAPLTKDEASRLAGLLPAARKVLKMAEDAVKTYAQTNGPIPLADGRIFGPQHAKRYTYATRISYEALAREIGDEAADAAFSTSKGAIYDAIGEAHEKAGIKRKKGAAVAKVLAEIAEKGGKTSRVIELWKAHYTGAPGSESDA
jgi:hypothetical protein